MAEAAIQTAPVPSAAEPPDGKARKKKDAHPRDPAREVIETIVFVVVLVLLLKLFVTEAFVIPTGSMAETLYGYQKIITCPKCGHEFPVNSHDEVEPNQGTGLKHPLVGYVCPNCRYSGQVNELNPVPQNRTGDRVLVLKPLYHIKKPARGDVVVFKYPKAPQEQQTAQNYIKRATAFGGETLAIHRGELFVTQSLTYPEGDELYPRPEDPKDLWELRYTYYNNAKATDLFEASRKAGFPAGSGGFEIVRKTDAQVLACKRIVWDNDQQPKELAGKVPPRWYAPPEAAGKWTADDEKQPRTFAHTAADSLDWVRYRHFTTQWTFPEGPSPTPAVVDNFLGYNAGRELNPMTGQLLPSRESAADHQWVGDLVIECEAELGGDGEVTLELSKGLNRFRAKFAGGQVALSQTGPGGKEFGSWPCKVNGPGKYRLRFANVDCRLRVWVSDSVVPVGTAADYPHPEPAAGDEAEPEGWTKKNDLEAPAGIGAKGAVTVRGVKLFRDIYYTRSGSDPAGADIYYVQPGHYMCMGDNSAQSSDSRSWGLVPERLILGKAVFVFFPLGRVGFIK
jgi:signal peptidase I